MSSTFNEYSIVHFFQKENEFFEKSLNSYHCPKPFLIEESATKKSYMHFWSKGYNCCGHNWRDMSGLLPLRCRWDLRKSSSVVVISVEIYWLLCFTFLASYCDRPLSVVVRRPSSVVRKLFYLNIFSSEAAHWILTKLHRDDPWVVPYQSCSNCSRLHK